MRPEIIVLDCSHKKLWIVLRISAKFYVQNLWTSFILSQWWGSQQQKILLITDNGTTDTTREALRYQQGAKGSYPASHFCNSFGTKNLAKASGCSKAWKHGRADPHTSLVTFQAVLRFSVLYRGMVTKETSSGTTSLWVRSGKRLHVGSFWHYE